MTDNTIPCPFVYDNGESCSGLVTYVESQETHVLWSFNSFAGYWILSLAPSADYRLSCSKEGSHGGHDDMVLSFEQLPEGLQQMVGDDNLAYGTREQIDAAGIEAMKSFGIRRPSTKLSLVTNRPRRDPPDASGEGEKEP